MQDVSKLCVDGVEMCCGCDLPRCCLDLLDVKFKCLQGFRVFEFLDITYVRSLVADLWASAGIGGCVDLYAGRVMIFLGQCEGYFLFYPSVDHVCLGA